MRTLLVTLALIAFSSGAQAYCYSAPESYGYAGNDLNRTLCLHDELSQSTQSRALQTEYDATFSKLQRDVQQQRFTQQQMQLELMRPPSRLLR